MIPQDAERDVLAALEALGKGSFPDIWKSSFLRAAAVVCRFCTPNSLYYQEARRVASSLSSIASDGTLWPGWDSPQGDMAALLNAVLQDMKSGALWRGLWDAKNDTCADILQQADDLYAAKYFAASAVLAGGALEAHLKDICERHMIAWQGNGTISKYQGVLAASQNNGDISFFTSRDGKFVIAWGDLRNRAAHAPHTICEADASAIFNMIHGIRDFIGRVP